MKCTFLVALFYGLFFSYSNALSNTTFNLSIGSKMPEFRLLSSNGKSYTSADFSSSREIVILFLTGTKETNAKTLNFYKSYISKSTDKEIAFLAINSFQDVAFLETDSTANFPNFIRLIDYELNPFAKHFLISNEPVLIVFNNKRQLSSQFEITSKAVQSTEMFTKLMKEALIKIEVSNTNEIDQKPLVYIDKTQTDQNYGISINVVSLNDLSSISNPKKNEEKLLLYFWSGKWDVSKFELADLNFTIETLKSIGVKLIPINVDGKKSIKKSWLTLFENACYGSHYVSEFSIADSKFACYKNIISKGQMINYAMVSNDGTVLFKEKEMVSLQELRKNVITMLASKKNEDLISNKENISKKSD